MSNFGKFVVTANDPNALQTDQSTPQTVINGRPVFNVGTKNEDDVLVKAGKKLVLDGD